MHLLSVFPCPLHHQDQRHIWQSAHAQVESFFSLSLQATTVLHLSLLTWAMLLVCRPLLTMPLYCALPLDLGVPQLYLPTQPSPALGVLGHLA